MSYNESKHHHKFIPSFDKKKNVQATASVYEYDYDIIETQPH